MLHDLTIFYHMLIAAALGLCIGWERKSRKYQIGHRTYAMVALGAAAAISIAAERFPGSEAEVMAGILAGIGFLGAGIIAKRDSGEARGLTTAASVWATAAMGIMVGSGDYFLGILSAGLIVVVLGWNRLMRLLFKNIESDEGE